MLKSLLYLYGILRVTKKNIPSYPQKYRHNNRYFYSKTNITQVLLRLHKRVTAFCLCRTRRIHERTNKRVESHCHTIGTYIRL